MLFLVIANPGMACDRRYLIYQDFVPIYGTQYAAACVHPPPGPPYCPGSPIQGPLSDGICA